MGQGCKRRERTWHRVGSGSNKQNKKNKEKEGVKATKQDNRQKKDD